MARLRLMRAPQKYVQGKDSLLSFYEEMKELGNKWLFICSKSGCKHNIRFNPGNQRTLWNA